MSIKHHVFLTSIKRSMFIHDFNANDALLLPHRKTELRIWNFGRCQRENGLVARSFFESALYHAHWGGAAGRMWREAAMLAFSRPEPVKTESMHEQLHTSHCTPCTLCKQRGSIIHVTHVSGLFDILLLPSVKWQAREAAEVRVKGAALVTCKWSRLEGEKSKEGRKKGHHCLFMSEHRR